MQPPIKDTSGPPELPPGFEFVSTLGSGGMATVYRVREIETGRELALKVMRDADDDSSRLRRFEREGLIAASLQHPGIVGVHSVHAMGGRAALLCELVEGAKTLSEAFRTSGLEERIKLLRDAALALAFAHEHGVVHRDVKPDNILVDSGGRVRVADFGLAVAVDLERLTLSGVTLGTPQYMAPEQVAAKRDLVGPATDVWALGVILYEALSGSLPFGGTSFVELFSQIIRALPERPSAMNPESPADLEAVCFKALEKRSEDRYPDAQGFADELGRHLRGEPVLAKRGLRVAPQVRKAARLGAPLVIAIAAIGVSLTYSPRVEAPAAAPTGDSVVGDVPTPGPLAETPPTPIGASLDPELEADMQHFEGLMGGSDLALVLGIRDARSARSLAIVGDLYFKGDNRPIQRDRQRAERWFRRAAAKGSLHSALRLGEILVRRGEVSEGIAYLHSVIEAKDTLDSPEASAYLGEFYLQGVGVKRDVARGKVLLRSAIEGGSARAAEFLGRYLIYQEPENSAEAVSLLRRVTVSNMAENSYLLGVLVLEGRGGEPDAEEGLGLLRRAAESERHVDAALYLTSYFERADDSSGVAKADQLRGIAAANARGQAFDSEADLLRYAFFLYTGFGVPRDRSEARSLLQEGLNRGVTLPPAIREALESEDDIPFPSGLTLPSPPLPPMPR